MNTKDKEQTMKCCAIQKSIRKEAQEPGRGVHAWQQRYMEEKFLAKDSNS